MRAGLPTEALAERTGGSHRVPRGIRSVSPAAPMRGGAIRNAMGLRNQGWPTSRTASIPQSSTVIAWSLIDRLRPLGRGSRCDHRRLPDARPAASRERLLQGGIATDVGMRVDAGFLGARRTLRLRHEAAVPQHSSARLLWREKLTKV